MLRLIIVLPPLQGHPLPTALNLGLISKSRKGLISKFIQHERAQLLVELERVRHGIARSDISSESPPSVDEILERYR